jgi:vacuolar-type H+-ATPase subunit I/STV1
MEWVVTVHSYWRWVVLLVGLVAIVLAVMSMTGRRPWDGLSDRLSLFFTITMDIQLLIGIVVWISEQKWSGDVMLGFVHPLAMIAAVALAHIGRVRADRERDDRLKGRQAALFFIASFVVILVAIPLGSWPV